MSIISPGLDVLEMVVRLHGRVVHAAIGIDVDLSREPVIDEQPERVVDGRLGDAARFRPQRREQLFRLSCAPLRPAGLQRPECAGASDG
jgi:hypothetical protein